LQKPRKFVAGSFFSMGSIKLSGFYISGVSIKSRFFLEFQNSFFRVSVNIGPSRYFLAVRYYEQPDPYLLNDFVQALEMIPASYSSVNTIIP